MAIETKSHVDDQQWLTYWVLYSLITLFELTFAKVIEWIPLWSYAKLIFSCWLVLPQFNGAAYVYQNFVRPLFVNHQTVRIWYVPRKKSIFSNPDDFLLAAEKFLEENGPDAFQKLMNKAGKTSKPKKKKGKRVTFAEVVHEKILSKPSRSNRHEKKSEPEPSTKSNDHVGHGEANKVDSEREHISWISNNLMIFDDNRLSWD